MDAETTSEADQRLASLPPLLSSVINTSADSAVISHAPETLCNVLGTTELWLEHALFIPLHEKEVKCKVNVTDMAIVEFRRFTADRHLRESGEERNYLIGQNKWMIWKHFPKCDNHSLDNWLQFGYMYVYVWLPHTGGTDDDFNILPPFIL